MSTTDLSALTVLIVDDEAAGTAQVAGVMPVPAGRASIAAVRLNR
jgi:hypothetical protein